MTENDRVKETDKKDLANRTPFFYGWVILVVGTLGIIMTGPGQTFSVSIFIEHIIEDLGISRTLVSTLYSIGTLVGGFSLPWWGRQIDRKGARKMVAVISLLFGLGCIFMGFVQNAIMLGFGFVMIRMMGQGGLGLVSQTLINQWWVRKRGMVMGISGLSMALIGMGAFPTLVYALISSFDWRVAYGILGAAVLLVMLPVGTLFFRNKPEDFHLQPDGATNIEMEDGQENGVTVAIEENWTLNEAMRTRTFWFLAISLSSFSLLSTGLFFHLVSIFKSQGLNPALAASVFVPVSIAAAVFTLASGFFADRIPLKFLLTIGLVMQAISLFTVQFLRGAGTAIVFGLILGATIGISRNVSSVVWPAFFGRANLGSIFGFITAISIVGTAIGPLPFGYVFDQIGSYQPVLVVSAGISVVFGLMILTIQKPVRDR